MTDRDKLIGLLGNLSISCEEKIGCINCKYNKETCCKLKRKADYLLENGVIVPPCNVGDTVYWLDNEKVKQGEAFEISIHSDGILVHTDIQFCLEVEDVFLTREEAEKALKERESNV